MRISQFGLLATAGFMMLASSALAATPPIKMLSAAQSKAMKECLDKNGVKPNPNATKPDSKQTEAVAKCYAVVAPPKAEKPVAPAKVKTEAKSVEVKAKAKAAAKKDEEKPSDE